VGKLKLMIAAAGVAAGLFTTGAQAGIRPLLPGEEVVYQTVQSGANYRTFYGQITGNAYTNVGDEILLGGTNRYITNIAVATQTYLNANTPAYMDGNDAQGNPSAVDSGGFLKLSLWLNDGPADSSSTDPFVEAGPTGQTGPGTLIAESIIPTPVYPQGGVSRDSNGLNDPNNPNDNANDPFIVQFPFNYALVPDRFTFTLVNLNSAMQPDGYNFDGNQFGLWNGTLSTTNVDPDANPATFNNNTAYNTNVVGQSRTGPVISLANNGQWDWLQYNGPRNSPTPWESDRDLNSGAEATIYAVPEPGSLALLTLGAGLLAARRSRR
jgi:hypothetical protein